ncbi:hypothetical protein WR25_16638 [Diploscapter pachys]|uniref:Uncharacterized protein n=1 Tax=Diploscapter pachys TaxID=2018661 RepID=A0A2A2KGA6_9BILA|nr:hypothetical protein WR25_16638 [Diploscapter pachys]
MPPQVDPIVRGLEAIERLDLNGGVADDLQQRLVAPHVAGQRRDVEIAGQDGRHVERFRPARHPFDEVELLAEFGVYVAIGNVTAGGDVDVFQPDAVGQADTDVARLLVRLPVEAIVLDQRHAAEDRDTMVHALAVDDDMVVAERAEGIEGEVGVDDLGFLEAQDVGFHLAQELFDDGDPETDRIDVPGDDLHAGASRRGRGGGQGSGRPWGRMRHAPSGRPELVEGQLSPSFTLVATCPSTASGRRERGRVIGQAHDVERAAPAGRFMRACPA